MLCLLVGLTQVSYAQDTPSVDLVPKWKKEERHHIKIKSTTTDFFNGPKKFESTFEVQFVVEMAAENGFLVNWVITQTKLAPNDPIVENLVLAKMLNTDMLIMFSPIGQFLSISNEEEVRTAAYQAIDGLLKSYSSNITIASQLKVMREMIAHKQGLEIGLFKHAKLYCLPFGYNYPLKLKKTNHIKMTNPLGGEPFNMVEKVGLTKLDTVNAIAVIEADKVVESSAIKKEVIKHLKRLGMADERALNYIGKAKLEMTEHTMHQIDFSKGITQKAQVKRVHNWGFQHRISVMELETTN